MWTEQEGRLVADMQREIRTLRREIEELRSRPAPFTVDAANKRIGLGVITPQQKFHLHGSVSEGYFQITDDTTGSGATDGVRFILVSGHLRIRNSENTEIQIFTNDIERATFLADGGVQMLALKSGTTQGGAGAAANELWVDTDDGNTIKLGS